VVILPASGAQRNEPNQKSSLRVEEGMVARPAAKQRLRRGNDVGDAMIVDSLCEAVPVMIAKPQKRR
jgi:hypothetical protein